MSNTIESIEQGNKMVDGRYQVLPNGTVLGRKGKPLKLSVGSSGYVNVNTWVRGKQKTYSLHRLVAQCYIPNPLNLPEVNHKDGDKTNCHVDNLEWCTRSSNIQHAFDEGLNKGPWQNKSGYIHPKSKVVAQYWPDGKFIAEFGSVREAAKVVGIHHNLIYDNIKGKLNSAGGFIWKYKE